MKEYAEFVDKTFKDILEQFPDKPDSKSKKSIPEEVVGKIKSTKAANLKKASEKKSEPKDDFEF